MLDPWKHKGHCVSAYMGDAMCQVGREEWGINMVGTVQSSRTGAVVAGCNILYIYNIISKGNSAKKIRTND